MSSSSSSFSTRWIKAALAAFCLLPALAQSDGLLPEKAWINPGVYSFHTSGRSGLRNENPGLGIEIPVTNDYSVLAGTYRNSVDYQTRYIGVVATPFHWGSFKMGAVAAIFDGYPEAFSGGWVPGVVPVIAFERGHWGVNILLVPTIEPWIEGTVSFQFKYLLGGR